MMNFDSHRSKFKQGLDAGATTQRAADSLVSLRKRERQEQLDGKRRAQMLNLTSGGATSSTNRGRVPLGELNSNDKNDRNILASAGLPASGTSNDTMKKQTLTSSGESDNSGPRFNDTAATPVEIFIELEAVRNRYNLNNDDAAVVEFLRKLVSGGHTRGLFDAMSANRENLEASVSVLAEMARHEDFVARIMQAPGAAETLVSSNLFFDPTNSESAITKVPHAFSQTILTLIGNIVWDRDATWRNRLLDAKLAEWLASRVLEPIVADTSSDTTLSVSEKHDLVSTGIWIARGCAQEARGNARSLFTKMFVFFLAQYCGAPASRGFEEACSGLTGIFSSSKINTADKEELARNVLMTKDSSSQDKTLIQKVISYVDSESASWGALASTSHTTDAGAADEINGSSSSLQLRRNRQAALSLLRNLYSLAVSSSSTSSGQQQQSNTKTWIQMRLESDGLIRTFTNVLGSTLSIGQDARLEEDSMKECVTILGACVKQAENIAAITGLLRTGIFYLVKEIFRRHMRALYEPGMRCLCDFVVRLHELTSFGQTTDSTGRTSSADPKR